MDIKEIFDKVFKNEKKLGQEVICYGTIVIDKLYYKIIKGDFSIMSYGVIFIEMFDKKTPIKRPDLNKLFHDEDLARKYINKLKEKTLEELKIDRR